MAKTAAVILGCAVLVCAIAFSMEPPKDTVYAKYLITRLDTLAFRTELLAPGQRQTIIVVPWGSKPGDTLLVATIWDGLQEQIKQAQNQVDQIKTDAGGMLKKLDSLLNKGGPK